jgi:hypothetical protein
VPADAEPGADLRPVDAGWHTDDRVSDRVEADPWSAAGRGR